MSGMLFTFILLLDCTINSKFEPMFQFHYFKETGYNIKVNKTNTHKLSMHGSFKSASTFFCSLFSVSILIYVLKAYPMFTSPCFLFSPLNVYLSVLWYRTKSLKHNNI